MYCQVCGTGIPAGAEECPYCVEQARKPLNVAGVKVREASLDALAAIKLFATNPVEGLPAAYDSLGPSRAIGVGLVFAGVSILTLIVGIVFSAEIYRTTMGVDGFTGYLKAIFLGVVFFACIGLCSLVTRKLTKANGTLGGDSFTAGVTMLPLGILALLAGLLGAANYQISCTLAIFAICLSVLLLYHGCTQIAKLSVRVATVAVPAIFAISLWLTIIIWNAVARPG